MDMYKVFSDAIDKKWADKRDEMTDLEKGVVDGYENGYAMGMGDEDVHDHACSILEETKEYIKGYNYGYKLGAGDS